jgi:type II secretory pathway pseudopilin PulG
MKLMRKASRRGSALLLSVIVSLVIAGVSLAFMMFSAASTKRTANEMQGMQALYLAESAAAMFIHNLNVVPPAGAAPPTVSSLAVSSPAQMGQGTYLIPSSGIEYYGDNGLDEDGDGVADNEYERNFIRFRTEGSFGGVTRKLEIVLSRLASGVYWNAIFAGNSGGNPYTLELNGDPGNGDVVKGDIYSGGGFAAKGSASLLNEAGTGTGSTVMYAGALDPGVPVGPNYQQGTQSTLDIQRNGLGQTIWEQNAIALRGGVAGVGRQDGKGISYFDVAYDLSTMGSTVGGANNGGSWAGVTSGSNSVHGKAQAQIMDQNEPSHIFRQNPTRPNSSLDRTVNYGYVDTVKNDFYIEDPTKTAFRERTLSYAINGDTSADGVYLSPNGNNAVYFVDGNLWVSHDALKSYQWVKPNGVNNMKVTIVVKGNVNFTDNLVYPTYQSNLDALAIIAIKDDALPNMTPEALPTSGAAELKPGLTLSDFVSKFNSLAVQAGNDTNGNRKIPDLDLTKIVNGDAAERARASSEFNRANGSGNVFYGDPGSGTVEYFEAYMYAENNFYATNLDSTKASGGTQKVEIFGNMTAGNQVEIQRDTTKAGYIPLKVSFDTKIKTGGVTPPGLPTTPGFGTGDWYIATWKQTP